MRFKNIYILLSFCFLLMSCYKDKINVDALTTNPWDMQYDGGSIIEIDTAYFDDAPVIIITEEADTTTGGTKETVHTYYKHHIVATVNNTIFEDNLSRSYSMKVETNITDSEELFQDEEGGLHQFQYEILVENTNNNICYILAITRGSALSKVTTACYQLPD